MKKFQEFRQQLEKDVQLVIQWKRKEKGPIIFYDIKV